MGRRRRARVSHGIVGDCPEIRRMLRDVRRYARASLPALVLGETGTGKELVARYLHDAGPRRGGPLVVVACPNLPAQLVESELFGHKRGAFTGAVDHRVGAFEEADGGTLFLDEVGDMPLAVQAKVLRVLQEGVIRRVGETRERRVSVRVVAATWRDLPAMVGRGEFREDLYNRLAYCVVQVPPLRDRGHDVALIARAFMVRARERHGLPRRSLSREAEELLKQHDWPGNVRELERVLYRAVATGAGRSLTVGDLVDALGGAGALRCHEHPDRPAPTVELVLKELGSAGAAELRVALGVSSSTLSRRLRPLLAEGRVVREGGAAATRYRLVDRVDARRDDPRWAVALRLASVDGRVTRSSLAPALKVSERTATRVLRAMVAGGVLVEDGARGRGAGYLATSAGR